MTKGIGGGHFGPSHFQCCNLATTLSTPTTLHAHCTSCVQWACKVSGQKVEPLPIAPLRLEMVTFLQQAAHSLVQRDRATHVPA